MSLASDMGWSDEFSTKVVKDSAELTQRMVNSPDINWKILMTEINKLKYKGIDKVAVAVGVGMFLGKMGERKGLL